MSDLVAGDTRERIVHQLRWRERTVDELAAAVGVTPNAVRQHLAVLERDGLVVRRGPRREGTVGKPATVYEIAPAARSSFSAAYAPALVAVLGALPDYLPKLGLESLFRDVGVRLAAGIPPARAGFDERVRAAAGVLDSLGALTEVIPGSDGVVTICGASCPLADAVAARPELCHAVEAMLHAVSGLDVREACDHTGVPRCRFRLHPA